MCIEDDIASSQVILRSPARAECMLPCELMPAEERLKATADEFLMHFERMVRE